MVKGIKPADVRVSLALSELKPLHAQWIIDVYEYLCKQPEIIKNGVKATGITGAVEFSHSVVQRIKNPFISNFYLICIIFARILYILKYIFEHEILCFFTNSQTLVKQAC